MRAVATAAIFITLFTACSETKAPTNSVTRPKSTATVKIVTPKSGETIDRNSVVAKLELSGGHLTKTVSKNITPDAGHIHLRLDGKTITLLGSLEEKIPAKEVKAGQHILEAEFVAADHGPFDPRVLDTVSFTAK
jgi:hypothetical protein